MSERNDLLVEDYLAKVSRATSGLPPERREELMRDLSEHIEIRRGELTDEREVHVLEILERLGDPEMIARAAAADAGLPLLPARAPVVDASAPAPAGRRWRTALIIGVIVLVVIVALVCVGMLFFAQTSDVGSAQ